MKNKLPLFLLIIFFIAQLSGCGEDRNEKEIRQYVASVKERKVRAIEPIPELIPQRSYRYPKNLARNPFQPVQQKVLGGGLGPDQKRTKEPLESYTLDSLRMVGVIKRDKRIWAVISAPDGGVYRVRVGNYLGKNYGKVVGISDKALKLKETFPSSKGWAKRDTTLSLMKGE